ncbi:MAG: TonB-dependent receptor [bacterium]|nr:TonB-dependent receptor [bacterium]
MRAKGFLDRLQWSGLCLVFAATMAFAGNTGKISGVVADAGSRAGLPGANVMIEGTAIGAVADLNGRFAILNVPPGVYRIKASMIGYRTMIVQNVRVSADLTTALDAALQPTTLESGETVTITAEKPLVQMDKTSSLVSVSSDEIRNLPVQSMNDVLELQAGVVRSGNDFHIRGGRAGEVSYWVDGVATNEVFGGGNAVTVERSAVQEMQVVSGTFNAEYGNAMSGIVNLITKEGGPKWEGQLNVYSGDYLSGDKVYSVLKGVGSRWNAAEQKTEAVERLENPLRNFNPTMNAELNLSGPVPLTGGKLSLLVNGRYFSQEGYLYGRRWFTPQGLRGDSALVPLSPYESSSGMAKLSYRLSSGIKASYSLFLNRNRSEHYYNHAFKYNPDGTAGGKGWGSTHLFSWNHVLSSKTFYEARVSRVLNSYRSYLYENPSLVPTYRIYVMGNETQPAEILPFDLNTAAADSALEALKVEGRSFTYIPDAGTRKGYVHPDSLRDPASYSYWRAGTQGGRSNRTTSYWIAKIDLTSQLNPIHQFKAGFEMRLHELKYDNYTLQPARKEGKDEPIVPYQPWVPPSSNIYHDLYTRQPREFSAYIQDKIELKDMIVNIGLRFDAFDANASMPADPRDPSIYTPFQDKFLYVNPAADSLVEYTPDQRRAFMQKKVGAKTHLSPRLGVAYPITDRGVIHFSYGHFFQIPEFQYLYANPDFKLIVGGGRNILGNAGLNPQKTVEYEIGFQQQMSDQVALDMTLFYKDIRDWVGTGPVIETLKPSVSYALYENKDYANVYGLTLNLDRRFQGHFGAGVAYAFQIAEGTYSNPTDAFNALQNLQEPRLAMIPLNWDQRHTLTGTATTGFAGWIATLQYKLRSGRPYTPSYASGSFVGESTYSGLRDNSGRLPNTSQFDLMLHKRFSVGAANVGFLVTVYNLFDQKGETYVYTETGSARYSANIDPKTIPVDAARVGTVEDFLRQPTWFIAPRQVQAGFTVEF